MFGLFTHVPLSILKRLAQQSQAALEVMQNAMDNNENGEDLCEASDAEVSYCVVPVLLQF